MTRREQEPKRIPEGKDSPLTCLLPPELADFLKDQKYACLTHATDKGTVFVVKAPAHDIESVRGRVPINLRHELYAHTAAPVIRMVLTIYDQPDRPLALETFINVEDPQQATDFATLSEQEEAYLLFYDEQLQHRLTKGINLSKPQTFAQMLNQAKSLLVSIPKERFNFEAAKAAVMARTKL